MEQANECGPMPTLTGAFNRISSPPLSSAFTQLTVILQRVEGSACPLHFPNFRNPTNPTCSFFFFKWSGRRQGPQYTCGGQRTPCGSQFSNYLGPRDQIQVMKLGRKFPYPESHPANPLVLVVPLPSGFSEGRHLPSSWASHISLESPLALTPWYPQCS